jgi:hypothetical protein
MELATIVLLTISFFFLIPISIILIDRAYFISNKYLAVKKRWKSLADIFHLETSLDNTSYLRELIFGCELSASGVYKGHPILLSWKRKKRNKKGEIICKVKIKNPLKISLILKKKQPTFPKGNVFFNKDIFRKEFYIQSNQPEALEHSISPELIKNIQRVFSIKKNGKITTDYQNNNQSCTELLGSGEQYFLVYSLPVISLTQQSEQAFIEETLTLLFDMGNWLDNLN